MSTAQALSLDEESFGERVHRAYRQGRALYGFTYREISDRITVVYPVSMQSLQRLEQQATIPRQARMRLVAYLALVAYGFDPETFGLNHENTPLGFVDVARAKSALDPRSGCFLRSEQPHDPKKYSVSAGQGKIGSSSKRPRRSSAA